MSPPLWVLICLCVNQPQLLVDLRSGDGEPLSFQTWRGVLSHSPHGLILDSPIINNHPNIRPRDVFGTEHDLLRRNEKRRFFRVSRTGEKNFLVEERNIPPCKIAFCRGFQKLISYRANICYVSVQVKFCFNTDSPRNLLTDVLDRDAHSSSRCAVDNFQRFNKFYSFDFEPGAPFSKKMFPVQFVSSIGGVDRFSSVEQIQNQKKSADRRDDDGRQRITSHARLLAEISLVVGLWVVTIWLCPIGFCRIFPVYGERQRLWSGIILSGFGLLSWGLMALLFFRIILRGG